MKPDLEALVSQAKQLQATGKRFKYPVDFKRKTVAATEIIAAKELVDLLGIGQSTLSKWKCLYKSKGNCVQPKSSKQNQITFAAVVPDRQYDIIESHTPQLFEIEFSDPSGRQLRVRMPWSPEVSGQAFQLINEALAKGGLSCSK